MATKLNVTKSGKNLLIEHNAKQYYLNNQGALTEIGNAKVKLPQDETKRVISAVLDEVENKGGKLKQETRAVLGTHIQHFEALGADADVVKSVTKNLKSAEAITVAAKAGKHDDIAKELLKNKDVEHYFGKETREALESLKVPFDWAQLDRFKSAKEGLKTLADSSSPTKDAVRKHLLDNFEHFDRLTLNTSQSYKMNRAGGGIDFTAIKKEITDGVNKIQGGLESALRDVQAEGKALKAAEKAKTPNADAIKKAKEALSKAEAEVAKITKSEFGAAALHNIKTANKSLVDGAIEASSTSKATIEGLLKQTTTPVGKAAEKSTSMFFKPLEKLEEIAKKEGKAVAELGTWTKMNTASKAAAIVVPLGIVAYLAGVGKKGKAAEINQDQPQPLLQQTGAEQVPARA